MGATGPAGAWLLCAPDLVPADWRHRVVPLAGVRLDAAEFAAVLAGAEPGPVPADNGLVPLVLQGLTQDEIATALHVSVRTVQRRIARLRARVGARSHAELLTALVRSGVA